MSLFFHLRVDYKNADDLAKCLDFIRLQNSVDTLMVLEKKTTNAKDHFHALFWTDTIISTFRQQFHRAMRPAVYDGKKNEYALIPVPEHERYDAEKYLCKGDDALTPPNVYFQSGKYTIEKVIELQADWYKYGGPRVKGCQVNTDPADIRHYGETIITHRVEKVVKPKKNFYNDVIEYLHRQYPDREWVMRDTPIMLQAILKLHGKHFRPYGPQQVENEMNVILTILCYDSQFTEMYDVLKNRGNIPFL